MRRGGLHPGLRSGRALARADGGERGAADPDADRPARRDEDEGAVGGADRTGHRDRGGHGGLWHAGASGGPLAAEGATFGLFPIMWIVVAAIWVYNMTVETGDFAVLRRSIGSVSEDQRIQAVLIAFSSARCWRRWPASASAAITATMMAALGFRPIKAAALAVLGNTAAVPFGALAIPIRLPPPSSGHRNRRRRARRDGRPPDAVAGAVAAFHPPRDG